MYNETDSKGVAKLKIFDTHTHLNADQFVDEVPKLIQEAAEQDVHYMAVVGFDEQTIKRSLVISETYQNIISVVGCHPTEAANYTPEFEGRLEHWLELPNVYMLGEIGLDYYWDTAPRATQAEVFKRQIAIAKEHNLPITIHNRDATEDVYRILKEAGVPAAGGIMHSFGGTAEEAKQFIDLGMHISFSGVLTFKKSLSVREAAKIVPSELLLVETDAPYLAPVPKRGKRNEPAYVRYVAEQLAEVRGVTLEEIAALTTKNAFELFRFQPE